LALFAPILFDLLFKRSLGMLTYGLCLRKLTGEKAGFFQVLARTLMKDFVFFTLCVLIVVDEMAGPLLAGFFKHPEATRVLFAVLMLSFVANLLGFIFVQIDRRSLHDVLSGTTIAPKESPATQA
jgi:uncharacterized RDD family membrane protein YckC